MDIGTLRQKQQELMIRVVERRVRSRAQQLYESRGQTDGLELQDWFQAESEVIENTTVAPLYRRLRGASLEATVEALPAQDPVSEEIQR